MRFCYLSDNVHRTCLWLRLRSVTIVVDCAVDFESLRAVTPKPLVSSISKFQRSETVTTEEDDVDVWEVKMPSFNLVNWADVDVVLLSNFDSLSALPFLVKLPGFRARVLATEPTIELGRLCFEEIACMVDQCRIRWKLPEDLKTAASGYSFKQEKLHDMAIPNSTLNSVFPTRDELVKCWDLVETLFFSQSADIFGLVDVTPYCSGQTLGSANWVIEGDGRKIVVISSSSSISIQSRALDLPPLRSADVCFLLSLTRHPDTGPDQSIGRFNDQVTNVIRDGGSVLVPCSPVGVVYDLIEYAAKHLDMCNFSTVPLFFVSPVAQESLTLSNVYIEWLSDNRRGKTILPDSPENPMVHAHLLESGRLKVFTDIFGDFSSSFQSPSIVFCGHSSLRFGNTVHLLENWHSMSKNMVALVEPDSSRLNCLDPYQPLAMKTLATPIDTQLNYAQVHKLLADLKPAMVVACDFYVQQASQMKVPFHSASDGSAYKLVSAVPKRPYHVPLRKDFVTVSMDPDLAESLMPMQFRNTGVTLAVCNAAYIERDGKRILEAIPDEINASDYALPTCYALSEPNLEEFLNRLKDDGITDVVVDRSSDAKTPDNQAATVTINSGDAMVVFTGKNSEQTNIIFDGNADEAVMTKVKNALLRSVVLLH